MKTINILSASFVIILLSSCMKILNDFEFEDKDPKIVVQARFNPDSVVRVFVTRSLDMFDRREVRALSEATVNLFTEEESLIVFRNDSSGWYSIDSGQIAPGKNYRLEIKADGYPKASSEFLVPVVPEIDRVDTTKIREVNNGPYWYGPAVKGKCTLHFNDNPETEDYYVVSMKRKIPQYIWGDSWEPIDTTFSYDFADISSKSPYLELVYHNYSGYQRNNEYSDWYSQKLIFSDKLFNGNSDVSIEILFNPEYIEVSETDEVPEEFIDIFFSSVDKHFYEYASAKAEINRSEGNPLAEPVTPYSNVIDGYGLVYGVSENKIAVNITGLFSEEDYRYGDGYYEY